LNNPVLEPAAARIIQPGQVLHSIGAGLKKPLQRSDYRQQEHGAPAR
jgi:hypothetical protein